MGTGRFASRANKQEQFRQVVARELAKEHANDSTYHKFLDKAANDFIYRGNGKDVDEYFKENSNYLDIINSMYYDQCDDFKDWCRGVMMNGQQYYGFSNMSQRDQERTRTYDTFIDQSIIKESIIVTRLSTPEMLGLPRQLRKDTGLKKLQGQIGKLFTVDGNMSFAAADEGLHIQDYSKQVEYHLHINGGEKGAAMYLGDARINHWGNQQREVITNRNIVIEPTEAHYDESRGVYVVQVYYRGRLPHDYN